MIETAMTDIRHTIAVEVQVQTPAADEAVGPQIGRTAQGGTIAGASSRTTITMTRRMIADTRDTVARPREAPRWRIAVP